MTTTPTPLDVIDHPAVQALASFYDDVPYGDDEFERMLEAEGDAAATLGFLDDDGDPHEPAYSAMCMAAFANELVAKLTRLRSSDPDVFAWVLRKALASQFEASS